MFNNLISIIIFSVFLLLLVFVPIAFAYFPFLWLKKKGYKRIAITFILVVFLVSVWSTYTAFYPRDKYYKKEFELQTGILIPKSGKILTKGASFPDMHGDYEANAIIKLDKNDFERIYTKVKSNSSFKIDDELIFYVPFDNNKALYIDPKDFTEIYTSRRVYGSGVLQSGSFTVGFDKENNLIGFSWITWIN